MNDKAIRNILIAYLKASNHEIRIYQEKSIGTSICDVMAVTDRLTGYEIKSDLDNYSRLAGQIKAYDRFFDENYLVVSKSHCQSAQYHVPNHWGILCIENDNITLFREALGNQQVSRRNQLTILWKLELKNLLVRNNMPLYAQRDRKYISEQLASTVEPGLLGRQITRELLQRDYSIYDAQDHTLYYNDGEGFPAEEIVDMLSEKNLEQMTLDKWIELYRQAAAVHEHKEQLYRAPTVGRTPHAIPYTDIEVSLGAPWVGKQIIADFIAHILESESDFSRFLGYEEVTGSWCIYNKDYLASLNSKNAMFKYGLERYNALRIMENTLNLREIKLLDNGTEYNERDTLAALEKQRLINEEFKRWIWLDEDRCWLVEEAYNNMFTGYEAQKYDGSALQFPDMSPAFTLYGYQKDAVQKILSSPNTLLAFDVGAGKTYIMIAAAMKMRSEGISRKNLFVVPNHIVGQWEKIFTDLYPKAKVLAVEPKSFKPMMRQKVLKQIRDGDYDGIIMAYSCFEMIPLSEDVVLDNMKQKLNRLNDVLFDARQRTDFSNTIDREKKYIKKLTREFLDSMTTPQTGDITFDELEINTLFVDEAHNYKNIPIRTKLKNLNGINTKGSSKCMDLLHKVRYVQRTNGGRGVVLATGTPLCNSISDAYAMQLYLQYDELEKSHLDVFDNWVKTFALPEQLCEIDVDTSKFRFVRRFSKFFNLPELSRMFSQIAIFHAMDDTEEMPKLESYTDVTIKRFPVLTVYMNSLCERTEAIRGKAVDRRIDNMLKVSTDGRKAALDLRLVGKEQPAGESSKICQCVERVTALYNKYPQMTQLIFCDYATPKSDAFNVYDALKEKLVQCGIPAAQIAFIHHYHTESRKLELFRKFNAGDIRILIGSTFKLGIGANVQERLKAIHHLDVPWRPADMIQREGRILRRGNQNKNVIIYRYITESSFDSYSWQILETKQRFITQFLTGTTYQRSIEDLENQVLTYAQVKALALAEPLMKQLAEKENEAKNLKILLSRERQTLAEQKKELAQINEKIKAARQRWETSIAAADALKKYDADARKSAYQRIKSLLTDDFLISGNALQMPMVLGMGMELPERQDEKKPYILLKYAEQKYLVPMGDTPAGNARRVINALKDFQKLADQDKEHLDKVVSRKEELQSLVRSPDHSYSDQLAACEKEVSRLREQIAVRAECGAFPD